MAIFENCRENESAENCRTVDETNAYWASNKAALLVVLPSKQIVMKYMENPIQTIRPYTWAPLTAETNDIV